jgi:geranylgeranyl diphosphate synthase type I
MLLQSTSNSLRNILGFFGFNSIRKLDDEKLDLISFQKTFNVHFKKYLDIKLSVYKELTDESLTHSTINHCVALMNEGGKRIRPYISFLAYHTEGGSDLETIQKLGIGLEIFHAFALIHDDIIDGGKERHGLQTIHEYIQSNLAECTNGDRRRIAEGMALLAGDLAFSWANEIVVQTGNQEVRRLYFSMIEETVAGQMLDVALVTKKHAESKVLLKKNELKTARYSFVNPMLIGAAEAGSHVHDTLYTKLGLCLGQAFQIQDDLLDIIGDPHKTGKTNMLDIQDGQHTFITQHVFDKGSQHDKDILASLFGKPVDDASKKVLSSLFASSGAIKYAETEVSHLFTEARKMIEESDFKPAFKKKWIALILLLDKRKS